MFGTYFIPKDLKWVKFYIYLKLYTVYIYLQKNPDDFKTLRKIITRNIIMLCGRLLGLRLGYLMVHTIFRDTVKML